MERFVKPLVKVNKKKEKQNKILHMCFFIEHNIC